MPRKSLALIVALLVAPSAALAERPTSQTTEYSPYEKETIQRALASTGAAVDPAPEGKTIERVDTLRLEVLEDRDPVPEEVLGVKTRKLANSLHYVSRDSILRREMLIHEGDTWEQVTIDEIARNMRARMPMQVSIVIIVPVKGSAPDKVAALVIAKDIWSLRLSFDMAVTPGGLENFLLIPQETNLLGLHHTAQTRLQYLPETLIFGVGYKIPRFGTSWIGASTSASILMNRRRLEPEGSSMSIGVGQGLYSTRTEWAWSAEAGYAVSVARRYVNAHVATYDSPNTPEIEAIRNEYKSSAVSAAAGVTRSFGWGFKNNFSLTLNAAKSAYETIDLSGASFAVAGEFTRLFVPVGETRVYPAFTWATFRNDYLRAIDINTLSLQEDYRLGHDVSASIYPVSKALGSTRDFVGVSARAGYAINVGDGLVGASVSTFAEDQDGSITDASFGASLGAVSPRTGIGRVVMNTSFYNRYRNYLRARTFSGGDDRLRGYPSNYFFGKDTLFYNLEFRTTSVELLKFQWGAVAFYDVGDASSRASSAFDFDLGTGDCPAPGRPRNPNRTFCGLKHSVGAGLRVLFPQVNRLVFRLDVAVPLNRGPFPETGINRKVDPVGFYFTFDQAFTP